MKKLLTICIIVIALPLMADTYHNQGRAQYVYKNYAKAKELFLKSAETTGNGNSYYFLGEIEKLQENYEEALRYYILAVGKKSIDSKYLRNAYWSLLVIAEQRGDQETVIKTCKSMWIRLRDPGAKKRIEDTINKYLWTDNETAATKYKEGLDLKKKNDIAGAEASYKEAMSISSSFLAPKVELGIMAYRRGDIDEAEGYLGSIADKISFYSEVHLVMGDISMRRQNWSKGLRHLNMVFEFGLLDSETEYTALIRRANCHAKLGHKTEAGEDLSRALTIKPGNISALQQLASIQIDEGKYDEALKTLHRAEKIEPSNHFVLYSIGAIYFRNDNVKFASYFDRLHTLTSPNEQTRSRYLRAYMILLKHNYDKKNYNRVIQIADSFPGDYSNHELFTMDALSSYYLKNYSRSITSFEKISIKNEEKLIYAKALTLNGNKSKAKEFLSKNYSDPELKKTALKDPVLKPLITEIDKESALVKGKEIELEKKKLDEIERKIEIEKHKEQEKQKADDNTIESQKKVSPSTPEIPDSPDGTQAADSEIAEPKLNP